MKAGAKSNFALWYAEMLSAFSILPVLNVYSKIWIIIIRKPSTRLTFSPSVWDAEIQRNPFIVLTDIVAKMHFNKSLSRSSTPKEKITRWSYIIKICRSI